MAIAERASVGVECLARRPPCQRYLPGLQIDRREAEVAVRDGRALIPADPPPDRERPAGEPERCGEFAFVAMHGGQVVHARCHLGVAATEKIALKTAGLSEKSLRPGQIARLAVDFREALQPGRV